MYKQAIYNYREAPVNENESSGEMSAEQMAVHKYDALYSRVAERADHSRGDPKEEEMVFQELTLIIDELENLLPLEEIKEDAIEHRALVILLRQFKKLSKTFPSSIKEHLEKEKQDLQMQNMPAPPPPPPIAPVEQMASTQEMIKRASQLVKDRGLRKDIAKDYAERVCACLAHKHKLTSGITNDKVIFAGEDCVPILMIGINEQCLIDDIAPLGKLATECPLHSSLFYQKYFKPIVEEIGHCCLEDQEALVVVGKSVLPDLPNGDKEFPVDVLSVRRKTPTTISLRFKENGWDWVERSNIIATSQTMQAPQQPLTEKDFFNARVKCIDPALETIFGKIGDVVQIIPREDCIEMDVNFGRHMVRVTDKQVQIIYGI